MRVAIGADHAGFALKQTLVKHLESIGHVVIDVGAHELEPSDDYPDFASAVAGGGGIRGGGPGSGGMRQRSWGERGGQQVAGNPGERVPRYLLGPSGGGSTTI